jgi:hypothetical protein
MGLEDREISGKLLHNPNQLWWSARNQLVGRAAFLAIPRTCTLRESGALQTVSLIRWGGAQDIQTYGLTTPNVV